MPKMIGISIGFVTNSSSMVHHFPKELLDDPEVAAFLHAFEIEEGYVGENLWNRGACGTVAITRAQKEECAVQLASSEYCTGPAIDMDDNSVVVIYGDEYHGVASILASMLESLAEKKGLSVGGSAEYN